jgi:hypothetical protein
MNPAIDGNDPMNLKALLILACAFAALWLVKRIPTTLLMTRATRQKLAEVGSHALSKLPEFVSLIRVDDPQWLHEQLVRQQADPLVALGFQDVGVYRVDKMPDVLIRVLCQPQTKVAAHIHDQTQRGVWIEMVTRYNDGSTYSINTLPPTGLNRPDWFRVIQVSPAATTDKIYQRYLAQRPQYGIKPVAPSEVVREFEEVFHRLAVWRKEAGISAQEVANVAAKRIYKSKGNTAGA